MIGEDEWRAGLQRGRVVSVDGGEALSEVRQVAAHGDVACELVGRPRRLASELDVTVIEPEPQPDVAEVHELGVLHIGEVGRVSEDAVEGVGPQLNVDSRCRHEPRLTLTPVGEMVDKLGGDMLY